MYIIQKLISLNYLFTKKKKKSLNYLVRYALLVIERSQSPLVVRYTVHLNLISSQANAKPTSFCQWFSAIKRRCILHTLQRILKLQHINSVSPILYTETRG